MQDISTIEIGSDESANLEITPNKDFSEGRLVMINGNQKTILIPYFERGYSSDINIVITSIDSNGNLTIK